MPLTRTQDEAALKFVVLKVMNQPDEGSVMISLAEAFISNVNDFACIQEKDILTYTAVDGTHSAIGADQVEILIAFCAIVRYRAYQSSLIGVDWTSIDWTSIAEDEYYEFRVSTKYDGSIYGNATRARDRVADFRRGIKHGASQIPILTEQKQLDNSQHTTITQTKDVAEKLDPTSTPITVEEKVMFRESQTFVAEALDPTCTPISAFVKSKSTNVDSFNDERSALICGSNPTVDTIDDGIMHRNVGLYDAHDRQVKMKYPDLAMAPTVDTISIARRVKVKDTDYATTTHRHLRRLSSDSLTEQLDQEILSQQ
jgi:hypothetical protein